MDGAQAAAAESSIVGDKSLRPPFMVRRFVIHMLFQMPSWFTLSGTKGRAHVERFGASGGSRYLVRGPKILGIFGSTDRYIAGGSSIFTESMIRRVSQDGPNMPKSRLKRKRLFGRRYVAVRYEDLLGDPFACMTRLWAFLGVSRIPNSLSGKIKREMRSNPDGEWQAKRGEELAAFLAKGQAGNWRRLFTDRDKRLFKGIAGPMLIKWKYEQSEDW
jgi:hypothetical protein